MHRKLFTGNGIIREKDCWWRAMRPDEVIWAQIRQNTGHHTGLITDIYRSEGYGLMVVTGLSNRYRFRRAIWFFLSSMVRPPGAPSDDSSGSYFFV